MAGVETLKELFDEKKIRILQVFVQRPDQEYTLKDIQKKSKVPLATTHRILKMLTKKNLLTQTKTHHLTTYKIRQGPDALFLSELLYEKPAPIQKFVDLISSIDGIQQVIMHGKEQENRANVVIIGDSLDKDLINAAVAQIRDEDHYTIIHLILDPEQYELLERMGQFSGTKTVLFST